MPGSWVWARAGEHSRPISPAAIRYGLHDFDFSDDERMAPLQQLERSIASGASSGANEHADGVRRSGGARSTHLR
jgi:hypothetical protein